MTVTHRQLSLEPLQTTERVYKFVEEKLTDEIREYVINMTTANEGTSEHNRHDGLNTFKNSTLAVEAWKNMTSYMVKYWDLFSIESQCKSLFRVLNEEFSVDNISFGKLRSLHLDV